MWGRAMAEQTRDDAIRANIDVHSHLANANEYNKSPHFLQENQEKVRTIIERLLERSPGRQQLLDFGCGTGFIIHLVRDLFDQVHGVDITAAMMEQVDTRSGNVFLHESLAESTPFESERFDFATAYSFMDHLFDYADFLKEAYRVLKPGGIFYSDLNPNRDFITRVMEANERLTENWPISPILEREIQGALHNGQLYQERFGIDENVLEMAEPGKSLNHGFDAEEVRRCAAKIGFSQCDVEYEWYLGQAKVMHDQPIGESDIVERYLNETLPASSGLFKYLRFIFVK